MTDKCHYCGLIHETKCPSVKAIEYFPDGTIRRVEFLTPADVASAVTELRGKFHVSEPYVADVPYVWRTGVKTKHGHAEFRKSWCS